MANNEYQYALDYLRKHKIRLTPQRKEILRYLINHRTHPSIEKIYRELRKSDRLISIATVYNTIKMLVDCNLVIEVNNGSEAAHYDYYGHPHCHVICDNCGQISNIFNENFTTFFKNANETTQIKTGYLITQVNVEVHGICPACQAKLGLG